MLDERTNILLKYINDYCKDQSYKVVDIEQLQSAFPNKFSIDKEGVEQMIEYLTARQYISVKYSDKEQYCLSPLPKGRHYFETQLDKIISDNYQRTKTAKIVFGASFAGAFLGSMITFLVSLFFLC